MNVPWFPASSSSANNSGGIFTTRCYGDSKQGYIFGPTIRVRPGDTLVFEFKNELEYPNPLCTLGVTQLPPPIPNLTNTGLSPEYACDTNATNLHTHGLHVSPLEDDISKKVDPGHSLRETIKIHADHMPALAWHAPCCSSRVQHTGLSRQVSSSLLRLHRPPGQ